MGMQPRGVNGHTHNGVDGHLIDDVIGDQKHEV